MASHNNNNNSENYDGSSSYFQRTVCLYDWWLTKAEKDFEGKRLAVAGFTSRQLQPARLFTSAPIVKRYDVFTLETADGICVIVKGFINKSRVSKNGFPPEVFKHFLFGFPYDWEKCAEKFLGEECSAGIESENASEFDKSTRDPVAAVAGVRDSIPILTPCKNRVESEDKHDIEVKKDNSCHESEKIAVDALKGCNLHNHVANSSGSVEEKSSVSNGSCVINSNIEGKVESNPSVLQNECQTSVAASPAKNDVAYVKNNATGNLPPTLGCDINAFNSLEDNIAVTAEPSGHCVMESSVRLDSPESIRAGKQRTMAQSNTNGSANIELSTSPVVRDFSTLKLSGKCVDTVRSVEETNHSTPFMVNTETANGTPNNFGSRKGTNCLRNLIDNQKQNRCFAKHKNKESVSEAFECPDGEQLKGNSSHTVILSGGEMDTSEATPSRSVVLGIMAKSLTENLRSREKKEQAAVQEESSSWKKTKRKIIFDTHKQNRCFVKHKNNESVSEAFECPDGEQLKGSSSHTVIYSGGKMDTSEATPSWSVGRMAKSLSGNLRSKEKKAQAAVQEEGSSGKKTKRKIIFDTNATLLTQERKERVSFTSPEFLGFKRSRSGRLLVPTLDFWRNQIPVYDLDRRLTGIQQGLNAQKPSRGSISEPQKKQRQIT